MEKEAGILIQEMKISLTVWKQVYAIFFIVILTLVRGVTDSDEVGIALEAPMAALALTFCADTYTQEIVSRRSEIWRLCPMKRRVRAVYKRLVIQEVFLLFVAAAGYGMFFLFQNPRTYSMGTGGPENEICRFLIYVAAVAVTLGFWGLLSNLISCLSRNMWMGIGGCLILWLITNSSMGDRCFGAWNLFSYTFRELEDGSDFRWIRGKIVCICIGVLAAAALPGIIKRQDR